MSAPTRTLRLYRFAERLPLGRFLFSRAVRVTAPYFLSIPAGIKSAEPGRVTAEMSHKPWVRNHLGGVHAIALCNLAEFAMGIAAEVTVPPTHRWIPKGMSVSYIAKASGTMHAEAVLELPEPLTDGIEVPVRVIVRDGAGSEVFAAEIRIWITERP
jgi:acyl-coenzyme A thioesterase PaaI-like protein